MAKTLLVQPDSKFLEGVMASGAHDFKKCFQCATCSAVCTLSGDGFAFPRKQMLEVQWGLKDKLMEDPGPWLCFYCGECSKNCPRKANPGETMMALRRYLTAEYDWTGLSRLMYRSAFWEIGILALVSAVIVALFTLPQNFGFGLLSRSGPAPLSSVMLSKFAPVSLVDLGDRVLFVLLSFFLLTNAARMFYRLTRGQGIPASPDSAGSNAEEMEGLQGERSHYQLGTPSAAGYRLRHHVHIGGGFPSMVPGGQQ